MSNSPPVAALGIIGQVASRLHFAQKQRFEDLVWLGATKIPLKKSAKGLDKLPKLQYAIAYAEKN